MEPENVAPSSTSTIATNSAIGSSDLRQKMSAATA
jgi:hypothetical protein